MHVLALTRYSSLGSSSRVRFYQYFPFLQSQGVEIQVASLLDDEYVRRLYAGKRAALSMVFTAYFQRLLWSLRSKAFDVIWLEKELFPWLPAWSEQLLASLRIPYVVDYDDAVFHRYDIHPQPLVRVVLGHKIDAVMRHAALVIVGNEYLAERAYRAGAQRVEILPSVVDMSRYQPRGYEETKQFRIGWIGSPVTLPYLDLIRSPLQRLTERAGVRLILIGAGRDDPLRDIPSEVLPWREATEARDMQAFDVGLMPLPDSPFERGKCGYKLIQYMAGGLPVIASPVGVNRRIVEHGVNGFLATSEQEWLWTLDTLYHDVALRLRMGQAGRSKAEAEYNLSVTAPRLLELLASVM